MVVKSVLRITNEEKVEKDQLKRTLFEAIGDSPIIARCLACVLRQSCLVTSQKMNFGALWAAGMKLGQCQEIEGQHNKHIVLEVGQSCQKLRNFGPSLGQRWQRRLDNGRSDVVNLGQRWRG